MPQYRVSEPIYLCDERRLVGKGEVFSSELPPGKAWIALDAPMAPVKRDVIVPAPTIVPQATPAPDGRSRPKGRR